MEFVLIRHAIAVERSAQVQDAERPLSDRGVRRFTKAVRGLAHLGVHLDQVFHSPWLRAAQTAALLDPITRGKREATDLLIDEPDDRLLALAAGFGDDARIGFVGHEPWMGELLSLCLTGVLSHADNLPFKKGGVAWLGGDPRAGAMALTALFPPRFLRSMAEARPSK
ncbi:MAG: histidine phosphatase family protein [Proteobacteria bacterium]|nr:histidine phosphatase family protein [Pseudomonadota bacterium]